MSAESTDTLTTSHDDTITVKPLPGGWADLRVRYGNGGPSFIIALNPTERKMLASMLGRHPNDDGKLICEGCGTTEGVTSGFCPYAKDIYDEEVEADLCDECYGNRCDDI